MIPEEFVAFSADFEAGFLVWIEDKKPTMLRTDFIITSKRIVLKTEEYDPLRLPKKNQNVTLVFSNPYYTEKCKMGIVKGVLYKINGGFEVEPKDITWTFDFDLNTYPESLSKRWKA